MVIGQLKQNSKVALIVELRKVATLNNKIQESTGKRRVSLTKQRDESVQAVKKISSFLDSQHKLSDKERITLFQLDLFKLKNFNRGFNI